MNTRSVVIAAPTAFYARANDGLVMGLAQPTVEAAREDLFTIDEIFADCPVHQWFAAAQAAMSLRRKP